MSKIIADTELSEMFDNVHKQPENIMIISTKKGKDALKVNYSVDGTTSDLSRALMIVGANNEVLKHAIIIAADYLTKLKS